MLLAFAAVLAAIAALLVVLDRIGRRTHSPNAITAPGALPLLYHGIQLHDVRSRMLEWFYGAAVFAEFKTFQFMLPFFGAFICITDPANVKHVLADNFDNYVKGDFFRDQFYELLGDGIFDVDGAEWSYQRKTAAHLFSRNGLRTFMASTFENHAQVAIDYMLAKKGPFDLQDVFYRYTLESIGQIAFGVSLGCFEKERVEYAISFDTAQRIVMERILDPWWAIRKHIKFIHPDEIELRRHVKQLASFAQSVIDDRRSDASLENREDLLSRFLAVRDDSGKPLHDDRLRDVIMSFIIAGRDTTANCLTWVFYELNEHPEVAERLTQEIDEVLNGQPATFDDIQNKLPYLHAVVQETLRLHPSVPKDAKVAVDDDVLPDGTIIPKGAKVVYVPWIMGRKDSLWDRALVFDPQRWLRGDPAPSHFKYIAFNAGPRLCLGMNMAYLEAQYIIVAILQRFNVHVQPGQDMRYQVTLTLPMKNGFYVTLSPRN